MPAIEDICSVNIDFVFPEGLTRQDKKGILDLVWEIANGNKKMGNFEYDIFDFVPPRISFHAEDVETAKTTIQQITECLVAAGCVIHKNMENNKLTESTGSVGDLQAWAVTVCERRGIRLVEAEEAEVKGRWDWIFEEQGMACESSFETQGAAALDAVETHFIVRDYEKEAYKAKQDKVFFPTYRDWVDLKADMELGKNTVGARPGM